MNKIHNNLNIENLMRTEWIDQFDEFQQEQITEGIEDNLDVSIYAKTDFDEYQMKEIRLGLLHNVDVSEYANPEYFWQHMEIIRERLEREKNEQDIQQFNNRKLNKDRMV